MLYTQGDELYDENKNIFLTSVNGVQVRVNIKYVSLKGQFINNWDGCKIMWVKCFWKNLPTLGDNTKNKIERSFWTLKQSLHTRFSTLPEIYPSIIYLESFYSEILIESTFTANLILKIHGKVTDICKLNDLCVSTASVYKPNSKIFYAFLIIKYFTFFVFLRNFVKI